MFASYFVLEGFDFGVGVLLPVLGKDDTDRRVMINTIGPVWDANETWLVLAAGAMLLRLKTPGGIRNEVGELATRLGVVTIVLSAAFLSWTIASTGTALSATLAIAVVAALVGALVANARGSDGIAFFLTASSVVLLVATYFAVLYPNVMPSTIDPANNLTIANATSSSYTLTLMSWVAVLIVPFVLAYQAWSYWMFRRRLSRDHIPLIPQHGAAAGGNRST